MMNHMDDLNNKFKTSAENFSLTPNATVWTKVEIAIQRRKRRRIVEHQRFDAHQQENIK